MTRNEIHALVYLGVKPETVVDASTLAAIAERLVYTTLEQKQPDKWFETTMRNLQAARSAVLR
jgi:hypothetical protein